MQPRGRGRSRGGHLLPLTTHIQLHSRPISAPPSPFHFTQTQSVYDQRAFPAHSHYPMPPHSAPLMGGMPHMPPSPLSQPPYGNHSIVYHERLGESQQSLSMPVSAATPRGQAGRWSNEGQLSAGSVLNQNTGSSTNHPLHAQSRNGRGRGYSEIHRRNSPHNGRDYISIPRTEYNELCGLREEVKNLRDEIKGLRAFRDVEVAKYYEELEKLKAEKSTNVDNDAVFRKHLENIPTRKDLSKAMGTSRRPTFPGTAAPSISVFDGNSKKAFNHVNAQGSVDIPVAKKEPPSKEKVLDNVENIKRDAPAVEAPRTITAILSTPHAQDSATDSTMVSYAEIAGGNRQPNPSNPRKKQKQIAKQPMEEIKKSNQSDVNASPVQKWVNNVEKHAHNGDYQQRPNEPKRKNKKKGNKAYEHRAQEDVSCKESYIPPVIVNGTTHAPPQAYYHDYNPPVIVDGSQNRASRSAFSFNPQANDFTSKGSEYTSTRYSDATQWGQHAYDSHQYNENQYGYEYQAQQYSVQEQFYTEGQYEYAQGATGAHQEFYGPQYQENYYHDQQAVYQEHDSHDSSQEFYQPGDPEYEHCNDQFEWQVPSSPATAKNFPVVENSQTNMQIPEIHFEDVDAVPVSQPTDEYPEEENIHELIDELVKKHDEAHEICREIEEPQYAVESTLVASAEPCQDEKVPEEATRTFNWADDESDDPEPIAAADEYPEPVAAVKEGLKCPRVEEPVVEENLPEVVEKISKDLVGGQNLPGPPVPPLTLLKHEKKPKSPAMPNSVDMINATTVKLETEATTSKIDDQTVSILPDEKSKAVSATQAKKEDIWHTVDKTGKEKRKKGKGAAPPATPKTAPTSPEKSLASTWASVASKALNVPTVLKRSASSLDIPKEPALKASSPSTPSLASLANVKPDGKRKLFIEGIPKDATYSDVLNGLKGGIIDDIFVSGLSPDLTQHYNQKQGLEKDLSSASWICYATFYSEKGAKNCIRYLNNLDTKRRNTDPNAEFKPWDAVTHIILKDKRVPVYIRPRDQRPIQPEIIAAVNQHQATRVLNFTFKRNVRVKANQQGSMSTWKMWKDGFVNDDGKEAIGSILRHLQVFPGGPKVYHESIKILPTDPIATPSKRSHIPKTRIEDPPEQTFKVEVCLLRISAALKVKSVLERNSTFNEHCIITYGHDHCDEMPDIAEHLPVPAKKDGSTGVPSTPRKKNKKKKTGPAPKIQDANLFPPLPGSAVKRASESPTPSAVWSSKEHAISAIDVPLPESPNQVIKTLTKAHGPGRKPVSPEPVDHRTIEAAPQAIETPNKVVTSLRAKTFSEIVNESVEKKKPVSPEGSVVSVGSSSSAPIHRNMPVFGDIGVVDVNPESESNVAMLDGHKTKNGGGR